MDMYSTKQYLQTIQAEYLKANKKHKTQLLNEAIRITNMNRKYLIRRLSAKTRWNKIIKRNKHKTYTADLIYPLVQIWDIFGNPCGQRLVDNINRELKRLMKFDEITISNNHAELLQAMSSSTIDRLLKHEKNTRMMNHKYKNKNNQLLYSQIPVKLSDEWDRTKVGQIQVDGVEHCGSSVNGTYVNTISATDIGSLWWEGEAIMNKGQRATLNALKTMRKRSPFKWTEIHPDNGTSFINYFIYDYARMTKLEFSRSRAYKKNDNCFVEQQNSSHVRSIVGHNRFDTFREQTILNDLYQNDLRLYKNFFQPIMRLKDKSRDKGHIRRKYHQAKTPYQWLLDNDNIDDRTKGTLKETYIGLNPAQLKRNIDDKLKLLNETYQTKQQNNEKEVENNNKNNNATVTFSFDRTTRLRLPSYVI
ncbi:MAG: Uncharacterized protein CEN91_465 [Candidatus Berkelbacteria bacterium Licking1014_85]|uniref:Integrase catalytic domain-containing protein n=1 Tax=Candidatus Berkelbacteria bacterium Licking1014_85 TaxID=2017148 RepID=A0A554LHP8_9BACT|nr:MAG: Uncharacterized protein CEN91_465 [Candidatus Berkelbacteria bacterium Licking1014_85]